MAKTWEEPKDPQEVADYGINWMSRLGTTKDIQTSVWTRVSGTVVLGDDDFSNDDTDANGDPAKTTTIRLSGGTVGETCELLNHLVLSNGEEFEQTCKLRIKAK